MHIRSEIKVSSNSLSLLYPIVPMSCSDLCSCTIGTPMETPDGKKNITANYDYWKSFIIMYCTKICLTTLRLVLSL